jgi:hypothetical protein
MYHSASVKLVLNCSVNDVYRFVYREITVHSLNIYTWNIRYLHNTWAINDKEKMLGLHNLAIKCGANIWGKSASGCNLVCSNQSEIWGGGGGGITGPYFEFALYSLTDS